MLNERFLARLAEAYPEFHARVDDDARADAARLLDASHGDVGRALVRARMEGALRVYLPYVKGSLPVVGRERDAMEAFSRLVLTVSHVAGHPPSHMEAARDHVVAVLRQSLDIERLERLVRRNDAKEAAAGAAAATGIMASLTTLVSPITTFRKVRRWARFVPPPVRVVAAAVVVAGVLSIPLVAGYSAGIRAERSAATPPGPAGPTLGPDGEAGTRTGTSLPPRSY